MSLAALLLLAAAAFADETVFQFVVVRPGDTLWSISNAYLKDPARWDEILKHNKLPSSDPTVALPGMTLRVPIRLIREDMRAAHLIQITNRVLFRRKETAAWKDAGKGMELFKGDSLRTLDASRARVRFLDADLLSLDANSLVIIKPPAGDADVVLKGGGIFVGRSRVITATARITPKTRETQYSAKVNEDLSTLVEVYSGLAAVEGQGRVVEVKAGMGTEVKAGRAPSVPTKIADLPSFEARAAEFNGQSIVGQKRVRFGGDGQMPQGAGADEINKATDASNLQGELAGLKVGIPISAYRVQASRSREFDKIVFDKIYDPDERFSARDEPLAAGVYWWRLALIDLLGTEGKFSTPRLHTIGLSATGEVDLKEALVLAKPAGDEEVRANVYRVTGLIKSDRLAVTVNGRAVRQDEAGNFYSEVKLKLGVNQLSITATDAGGHSTTITRRITYTAF